MTFNFINKKVKVTKKEKKEPEYKTILKNGKWFAKLRSNEYEIIDSDNLEGCTILYSLPDNTAYPDDEIWTVKRLGTPISKERAILLKNDWSKYRPNLIVKGTLICKFIETNDKSINSRNIKK